MFRILLEGYVCMFVAYVGTIRRFLEHYGEELELVVFVTDGLEVS